MKDGTVAMQVGRRVSMVEMRRGETVWMLMQHASWRARSSGSIQTRGKVCVMTLEEDDSGRVEGGGIAWRSVLEKN